MEQKQSTEPAISLRKQKRKVFFSWFFLMFFTGSRLADNVFCGFFTFELIVRLGAMARWEQVLDAWSIETMSQRRMIHFFGMNQGIRCFFLLLWDGTFFAKGKKIGLSPKDGWFLFDSMLTIMMIWDTWTLGRNVVAQVSIFKDYIHGVCCNYKPSWLLI